MNELNNMHAEMCKVFTNPTRIEVLNLLREGEMSVSELIEKTKLSQANISQHLSIMKNKGIVQSRRDGKKIYYELTNKKIIQAFDIIREILSETLRNKSNLVKKI
jgi:ArsR family transcriptional regulator